MAKISAYFNLDKSRAKIMEIEYHVSNFESLIGLNEGNILTDIFFEMYPFGECQSWVE